MRNALGLYGACAKFAEERVKCDPKRFSKYTKDRSSERMEINAVIYPAQGIPASNCDNIADAFAEQFSSVFLNTAHASTSGDLQHGFDYKFRISCFSQHDIATANISLKAKHPLCL